MFKSPVKAKRLVSWAEIKVHFKGFVYKFFILSSKSSRTLFMTSVFQAFERLKVSVK